jgi:transcriptional regulator with XRE-family HTH domain
VQTSIASQAGDTPRERSKPVTELPAADRERGSRILYVHLLLMQQRGNEHVSLEEFGKVVAREESKLTGSTVNPYSASSVSRWESGESPPSHTAARAMCRVVKAAVGPGWIVFGPDSAKGPKDLDLGLMGTLATARASGRRGTRR